MALHSKSRHACRAATGVGIVLGLIAVPATAVFAAQTAQYPGGPGALIVDNWWLLLVFLAVGVGPFAFWGPVYRAKCETNASFGASLLWGLGAWAYSFYTWVTTPRSFARIVLGRSGWAKTRRNAEIVTGGVIAKEA